MGTIPDSRTLNPFVSFEERKVAKVRLASRHMTKRNKARHGTEMPGMS